MRSGQKSKRFTLLGLVRREKRIFNKIISDEDIASNFKNVFYLKETAFKSHQR